MKVAIFADIHGKILLPFKLVDLYQRTTGEQIDFILQCGDMGAYPILENLDKATIKHAKNNPEELGFHAGFTKEVPAIKAFLDQLNIQMYCVRGNHEDHDFLDALERDSGEQPYFSIAPYDKVLVCKTGHPFVLSDGKDQLTIAGIGRIGDRKGRNNARFIQDYEKKALAQLIRKDPSLDILLTHDKDDSSQRGYGMKEIRDTLDRLLIRFHFYGHTGEPYNEQLDTNRITRSIKIKELEFEQSGVLPENCMVVLEKSGEETFHLKTVDQSFTNQLTKFNWKF